MNEIYYVLKYMIFLLHYGMEIEKKLENAQKDFQLSKNHYNELFNRLNLLMKQYEPDRAGDARHSGWQGFLMTVFLAMNTFKNFAPVHAGTDSLLNYCWYHPSDEDQRKMMVDTLETMLRVSFLTIFMFQAEVFIKSIATQLGINLQTSGRRPKQKGYRAITNEMINLLFSENQQQKIDFLNLPAMVRNCLHSSGYHKEDDYTIYVDNYVFEFKTDEKIEFASWQHFHLFITKLVDVLEEILNLDTLESIETISKYNFVSD